MRKAYSRVRVSLMTFALGLAAVWFVNGPEIVSDEVPVQLPTAVSSEIFTVFPTRPGQVLGTWNTGPMCTKGRWDEERYYSHRARSKARHHPVTQKTRATPP